MTDHTSDLTDALELAREALRVANAHLRMHGSYNLKVARAIELAEREADKVLARTEARV